MVVDGVFGSSLNGYSNLLDSGHNYAKEQRASRTFHSIEPSFTVSSLIAAEEFFVWRHEGPGGALFLPHSHIISQWMSRKLSLLDEGIYMCYVGTATRKITHKVELKVGAFITPAMKYEKRNTNSFLICSVLSVYPRPIITWQVDNIPTSESSMEENGSLGPFNVNSRINITGSNSSYECAIENSLLEQTWTGRWTMKDGLHKMQSENFSLSCDFVKNFFLLNQEFIVTWSRLQSGTSSILGYFLSSSRNTVINEPRLSWTGDLINQSDFSLTLKDLGLSDSGEYLCNISSSTHTSLTVQTLHVGLSQRTLVRIIILSLHLVALVLLVICII
ncbi:HERV-H LTR-associating protein 2 [Manis pentadactyla]|uniref:HERV-H LTR-associating protein 2 n=1 Tax=Manis pentadactyla TaxID=143292 RepID=UPI00255CCD1A|nr:HERV-H LTR-associating protein 2 [Manis pentadactyla]